MPYVVFPLFELDPFSFFWIFGLLGGVAGGCCWGFEFDTMGKALDERLIEVEMEEKGKEEGKRILG